MDSVKLFSLLVFLGIILLMAVNSINSILSAKRLGRIAGEYKLVKSRSRKAFLQEIKQKMERSGNKRKFLDFLYNQGAISKREFLFLSEEIEKKLKNPLAKATDWLKRSSYEEDEVS